MAEFTLTEVLQALPQAKVLQKQGDKFDNIMKLSVRDNSKEP